MATNATLTLQAPPMDGGKIVKLSPASGSGSISWQDLQVELAMMLQTVLTCMSNMLKFISNEQQQNAESSAVNIDIAKLQTAEANKEYKAELAAENPPWYDKLLDIVLKYILPIALAIVSLFTFGVTAFLIAAVVLAVTLIPMNSQGESLLQITSGAIAQGIGDAFNLSPNTVQIIKGVVGIYIALALAVLGGVGAMEGTVAEVAETTAEETGATIGEATGETAGEAAGEAGETAGQSAAKTAENAASKFKMNAGKFTAFNTFASASSNTNCFYNLFYGSYMAANPTADKQKAAEYAEIFAMVMQFVTSLYCMYESGSSLASGVEDATTFNPIAKGLGTTGSTALMRAMNIFQGTSLALSGAADIPKGITALELGKIMAALTRAIAMVAYALGSNSVLNTESGNLTNFQKEIQAEYATLLGHQQNFAGPAFTEASGMMGG